MVEGAETVAVKLPPLVMVDVNATVGLVVSITTPVNGVGEPDVTVPLVCFTAIE